MAARHIRSQVDSEQAALNLERAELEADDQGERWEPTAICVGRGFERLGELGAGVKFVDGVPNDKIKRTQTQSQRAAA
jgi:hypothetical protein